MIDLVLDTLFTHIWQIALLAVVLGPVANIVGRQRPHLAYALWLVVLAKCLVPPLWVGPAVLPGWQLPPLVSASASPTTTQFSGGEHSAAHVSPLPGPQPDELSRAAPENDAIVLQSRTAAALFVSLWAIGVAFLSGRMLGRGAERGRLLRRTSHSAPQHVQRALERAAQKLDLRRPVTALCTSTNIGPGVSGVRRPVIYIPQHLVERLPPGELQTMLAHELAHVRRRDTWVASLQVLAQIAWWFHPMVWWMNRELARHRERCCDEEVVASLGGERRDYARCLVRVLEAKLSLEPLWGYPGVRPVELTRRRLEEIMTRPNMSHRRAPRWCGLVAAAIALVVLPAGGVRSLANQATRSSSDAEAQVPAASGLDRVAGRPVRVLKYGDNEPDGKKSIAGAGEMIRFTLPEGVSSVRALRVHCARYGYPQPPKEDVEITFLNEDMTESLHTELVPYSLFKRTKESRWTTVPLDEPVELPSTFWVVLNFNAEQTKGVYVSYDTDTKGEYSRVGFNEEDAKETDFGGDWMIQVLLPRP